MKNKCIKCALIILSVLFILSGCAPDKTGVSLSKYETVNSNGNAEEILAQNVNYILGFDENNQGIYIKNKNTEDVFSPNPLITGKTGADDFVQPQLRSDISIDYVDTDGRSVMTAYSFIGCVSDGSVTYKKNDNGCTVTYNFEQEEISVPIDYSLIDDGIYVSFDPKKIKENERKVLRVSINPFMCAIQNDHKDSYLFIPSGSGAIVYPNTVSEVGNVYSQYVYGNDPTVEKWGEATNEQNILLPVFGAKTGKSALCAIIEEGAEASKIDATVGGSQYGFSSVYCTFDIRAYSPVQVYMYGYKKKTTVYSDGVIDRRCGVGFYPLYDDSADYSGMAARFREKSGLKKQKGFNQTNLNLVVYGGTVAKKSFFGIPYDTVYAATTVNQAKQMINEISKGAGTPVSVLMKGFGSTGINIGEICGGYEINKNLGSISDLKSLSAVCKDSGIDLYFDFDAVRQSDNSWFSFKKSAKSPNNQTVYQYDYDMALKKRIDETRYSLLSRDSLISVSNKLLKKTDRWDLPGIGLASLSSICYSDNSTDKYLVCGNMPSDVSEIIKNVKEQGKKVAAVTANYYAAECSDIIFESPDYSNKNDVFSFDIPFYQMVFRGYVPVTSEIVNLSNDMNTSVLKAVESGEGVTYGFYKNYDVPITDSRLPVFNTGTYDDIKDDIISTYDQLRAYYDAIGDSGISRHNIIDDFLRIVEFDNGVSVYINYSSEDIESDIGVIKAGSWLLKK